MATPSVRVSVGDVENGAVQSAGSHGVTYPTIVAIVGMTTGGSGSQNFTNQTGTTLGSSGVHPRGHHHE